jgi:hypothetical protein
MYAGQERELIRGVFAAYCDVLFSKQLTATKTVGSSFLNGLTWQHPYVNGKSAVNAYTGIRWLGAFSGEYQGGTYPTEVVRVRMVSKAPGKVDFVPSIQNMSSPVYDTLVYGNLAATPPEQSAVTKDKIECVGTSLTITN